MPRMRTIAEAAKQLKQSDPQTAITPYALRRMVLSGEIPCVYAGKKRLVNLDQLEQYFSNVGR